MELRGADLERWGLQSGLPESHTGPRVTRVCRVRNSLSEEVEYKVVDEWAGQCRRGEPREPGPGAGEAVSDSKSPSGPSGSCGRGVRGQRSGQAICNAPSARSRDVGCDLMSAGEGRSCRTKPTGVLTSRKACQAWVGEWTGSGWG